MRHVLVLAAFVCARLANVGAQGAQGFGMLAVTRHEGSRDGAELGAIHVQRDALCHHLDIRLFEAGRCAVVASQGAGVAGFDAAAVFRDGIHFWFSRLRLDA